MTRTIDGISVTSDLPGIQVGIVVARGCAVGPAEASLAEAVATAVREARERRDAESVTRAVRDLLRRPAYKPTGRGKPASEYLLNAARDDRFPRINNLVDINNLVSVRSLLPSSLIDLDKAGSDRFVLRLGREGESYVFNPAGQVIDLHDLLLLARLPADEPCANAIKDAMATKLDDGSTNVMGVLYGSAALAAAVRPAIDEFARSLERWGGARSVAADVFGEPVRS